MVQATFSCHIYAAWRGNCQDNAPVKSFLELLKRERIRRRIYPTKDAARADAFDYIEMLYNPTTTAIVPMTICRL